MSTQSTDQITDGMGRPIAVSDLVTAHVPICCATRRGPGELSDLAQDLLDRTRDGRVCGIVSDTCNGLIEVLWPEGDSWRVPCKLLLVEKLNIEARRNAG